MADNWVQQAAAIMRITRAEEKRRALASLLPSDLRAECARYAMPRRIRAYGAAIENCATAIPLRWLGLRWRVTRRVIVRARMLHGACRMGHSHIVRALHETFDLSRAHAHTKYLGRTAYDFATDAESIATMATLQALKRYYGLTGREMRANNYHMLHSVVIDVKTLSTLRAQFGFTGEDCLRLLCALAAGDDINTRYVCDGALSVISWVLKTHTIRPR